MTDVSTEHQNDQNLTILHSKEDASVNFVRMDQQGRGYTEARYVRRSPDYFICYLSSHLGCNMGCRMCHLTITGQTKLIDVPVDGIIEQARDVLSLYDLRQETAEIVHFSFMARGEPLASQVFHTKGAEVMERLAREATKRKLFPRIMVSTIMPQEMKDKSLAKMFPEIHPNIYYSIYSVDPAFRKKWLPKAMPVDGALAKLADYQNLTHKIIRLHWAFIKGENDTEGDIHAICNKIEEYGIRADVNIVRYNPYSEKYGEEPSEETIESLRQILIARMPQAKVKVVPRVGRDVKASCGMFVEKG